METSSRFSFGNPPDLSVRSSQSRRRLEKMPFDKRFDVDGNSELCHATGYEVFDGEDWWDEFVDSNGDFQYGR